MSRILAGTVFVGFTALTMVSFQNCGGGFEARNMENLGLPSSLGSGAQSQPPPQHSSPVPPPAPMVPVVPPPVASFGAALPAISKLNSLSFEFQTAAKTECRLDMQAFALCNSPRSVSDLSEGEHVFTIRLTNSAGVTAEASHRWQVDLTSPVVTIGQAPPPINALTAVQIPFTAVENALQSVECSFDSGNFQTCTSPFSKTGLTTGDHSLIVKATDQAGNVTSVTTNWKTDLTPPVMAPVVPTATILTMPPMQTSATNASFTFSAVNGGAGVQFRCSLDSAAAQPCVSPANYTGLTAGARKFTLTAVSMSGAASAPVTYSWTILGPPVITTALPATKVNYVPSAMNLSVVATGAGLTYQWSKNGVVMPGRTGANLMISPTQTTDAGRYEVTVSNASGSVKSASVVTIFTGVGSWRAPCKPGVGVGPSSIYKADGTFSIDNTAFDLNCTPGFVGFWKTQGRGTYTTGDMVMLADGREAQPMDVHFATLTYVPITAAAATRMNQDKICGIINWVVGVPRDIIATPCGGPGAKDQYTLGRYQKNAQGVDIWLDGDRRVNDASTPALRPTAIDPAFSVTRTAY